MAAAARAPKRAEGERSRSWVFTWFPPPASFLTPEELPRPVINGNDVGQDKKVNYAVFQHEVCPKSGKHHWQGFIEGPKPLRFTAVKKLFTFALATEQGVVTSPCTGVHVEPSHTPDAADKYAQKEETRFPGSRPVVVGARRPSFYKKEGKQMDNVVQMVQDGHSIEDIEDAYPRCVLLNRMKIIAAITAFRNRSSAVSREIDVEIWWGDHGTGKTHHALTLHDPSDVFKKSSTSGVWFDGYSNQKVLLLDEFYGQLPIDFLLNMCDKWKTQLQVKFGMCSAQWTKVIITSNKHPDFWWPDSDPEVKKAFMDRVSHVVHFRGESRRRSGKPTVFEEFDEATLVARHAKSERPPRKKTHDEPASAEELLAMPDVSHLPTTTMPYIESLRVDRDSQGSNSPSSHGAEGPSELQVQSGSQAQSLSLD